MLKTISKVVLVAAIAAMVVSFSTPSFAQKKKKMAAAPETCAAWQYKTAACNNLGWCSMQRCGIDGKWYPSLMACWQAACPK